MQQQTCAAEAALTIGRQRAVPGGLSGIRAAPQIHPVHPKGFAAPAGYLALPNGGAAERLIVSIHNSLADARRMACALGRPAARRGWAALAVWLDVEAQRSAGMADADGGDPRAVLSASIDAVSRWLPRGKAERFFLAGMEDGAAPATRIAMLYPEKVLAFAIASASAFAPLEPAAVRLADSPDPGSASRTRPQYGAFFRLAFHVAAARDGRASGGSAARTWFEQLALRADAVASAASREFKELPAMPDDEFENYREIANNWLNFFIETDKKKPPKAVSRPCATRHPPLGKPYSA